MDTSEEDTLLDAVEDQSLVSDKERDEQIIAAFFQLTHIHMIIAWTCILMIAFSYIHLTYSSFPGYFTYLCAYLSEVLIAVFIARTFRMIYGSLYSHGYTSRARFDQRLLLAINLTHYLLTTMLVLLLAIITSITHAVIEKYSMSINLIFFPLYISAFLGLASSISFR
jgi:hypothetical protein